VIPKKGGEPLPPAPICLPKDHKAARLYAQVLKKALEQTGWSAGQRAVLYRQYRKWLIRGDGRDEFFEEFGTFRRFPGTAPPTTIDLVVERWRRAAWKPGQRLKPKRYSREVEQARRLRDRERIRILRRHDPKD
jgi:hypothetical protein